MKTLATGDQNSNGGSPLPAATGSECGDLARQIILAAVASAVWRESWLQWVNFAMALAVLRYMPRRRSPNNKAET